VLDRESTFAHPEIVELLKSKFIPVAIDQAYERRQKDTEGDFYRKIAGQGPRSNFQGTTQGFYISTAAGELLLYNNNRDPDKVARLMKQKLSQFADSAAATADTQAIKVAKVDPRYNATPPEGGLVLRVHAKVLQGYSPTADPWKSILQASMSRDNFWLSAKEHQALVRGEVPASLQQRLARYHLVDGTRGEPPMWRAEDVRDIELQLEDGNLTGTVKLSTKSDDRGYDAELKGEVQVEDGKVTRFDMVCLGKFWGEGRYTGGAPRGKFPLAISFTLADGSDMADGIPPQASRGWLEGYLRRGE